MEEESTKRFGFARIVIDSHLFADTMNYVAFSVIAISSMFGFILGGFYGIGLVALGIIASPVLLSAINASAGVLEAGNNF